MIKKTKTKKNASPLHRSKPPLHIERRRRTCMSVHISRFEIGGVAGPKIRIHLGNLFLPLIPITGIAPQIIRRQCFKLRGVVAFRRQNGGIQTQRR